MNNLLIGGIAAVAGLILLKKKSGAEVFPVAAQTPADTRPLGGRRGPGSDMQLSTGLVGMVNDFNLNGYQDGLREAPVSLFPFTPNQNVSTTQPVPSSPVP